MNTLDLFDFTAVSAAPNGSETHSAESAETSSSSTPTAQADNRPPQPTLNEEVTQVFGQLGRFWGGVRKQSQSAFEAARKDLGDVVSQAQKEFEKYSQRPSTSPDGPAEGSSNDYPGNDDSSTQQPAPPDSSEREPSPAPTTTATDPSSSSSLLARLQGTLPQNLTPTGLSATLQRHLPENLQHGLNLENASADLSQLRTALAENIQRVQQGTTVQQAEKLAEQYLHKGEELFSQAGEFLKDAVKIVPPEEGEDVPGVVWDGTDVWTMPTQAVGSGSNKGKEKERDVIFSVPRAAAKRTDTLLRKLRSDPQLIRKDPKVDEDESARELWSKFISGEVDALGPVSGEGWVKKIGAALEGHDKNEDTQSLIALRDQLVPTELTDDEFWMRYFFRVHQIESDEERRKALLADANNDEEHFSWEDEDDGENTADDGDGDSKKQVNVSSSTLIPSPKPSMESTDTATITNQNPTSSTSRGTSPRESEDSYDVVSSGNTSSAGGKAGEKTSKDDNNEDDSDWE